MPLLSARHSEESWRDRVRGCLLGAALGDAVGRPFEGHPTVSAADVEALTESPGQLTWTDDTALLLALSDHLAGQQHPAEPDDDGLARAFARAWQDEPHRGYGGNPPRIFAAVLAGSDWRSAAVDSFGGTGSFGNGGAMRAAPVGALPLPARQVAEAARRTAAITHAHPDGQDGAAAVAVAAWACLRSEPERFDPEALLATVVAELTSPVLVRATERVADTLAMRDPAEVARVTGTGVPAAEAVPAALSGFLHHPADPVRAITFAVGMGGDTDTVATMAGALAGALAGAPGVPPRLVARLERAERVQHRADRLAASTYRSA